MTVGRGRRVAAGLLVAGLFLLAGTAAGQQGHAPAGPPEPPAARDPLLYRIWRVDPQPGPAGPQAAVSRTRFLVGCGTREGVQVGSVFTVYRGDVRLATVRIEEVWRDTSLASLVTLSAKPNPDSQLPLERGDRLRPRYVLLPSVEVSDTEPALNPEMEERLHWAARLLRDFPDLPLLIEGHTDDAGKAADNRKRSEQRAARVRDFLQRTYLFPLARMHVRGYGEDEPIAANSSVEGRAANKRVDLILADQVPPEPPPPPKAAARPTRKRSR